MIFLVMATSFDVFPLPSWSGSGLPRTGEISLGNPPDMGGTTGVAFGVCEEVKEERMEAADCFWRDCLVDIVGPPTVVLPRPFPMTSAAVAVKVSELTVITVEPPG